MNKVTIELNDGETLQAWARRIVIEGEKAKEPERQPLMYKEGDIVLMPVRVIDTDPDRIQGTVYLIESITPSGLLPVWVSREALEPPAPQVGDRVVGWDDLHMGELDRTDDSSYPNHIDGAGFFEHAVRIP